MRYPVKSFKTEWNGTAGYGFGAKTSYGYHEGVDINDNLGGNSDLGKEILCIANGELVYYHSGKHPTTGFGYHSVYKISGSWGTRWVHQAHCMPDLTIAPKTVSENEVIAKVGNSGTTYAHIHFAIFKVDPATLPSGIDTIAKTQTQLNDWWEDPIAFIERNINAPQASADQQAVINELRTARDTNWNLYSEQVELVKQKDARITELEGKVSQITSEVNDFITKAQSVLSRG